MNRFIKIGLYLFFITSHFTVFSQGQTYIVEYIEEAMSGYKTSSLVITPQRTFYHAGIYQYNEEEEEVVKKEGGATIIKKTSREDFGIKQKPTFHLVDISKGMMRSQENNMFEYVLVEEPLPKIKWEIFDEEKMIADTYRCKKAVGDFRGRTYTVWFAEEIPISSGPWKLNGLPGLILEAEESEGKFFFKFKSLKHIAQKVDVDAKVAGLKVNPDQKPISWEMYKPIFIERAKKMADFIKARQSASDNDFDENTHTHTHATVSINILEKSLLKGSGLLAEEQKK